jgi:hypothetical protein
MRAGIILPDAKRPLLRRERLLETPKFHQGRAPVGIGFSRIGRELHRRVEHLQRFFGLPAPDLDIAGNRQPGGRLEEATLPDRAQRVVKPARLDQLNDRSKHTLKIAGRGKARAAEGRRLLFHVLYD